MKERKRGVTWRAWVRCSEQNQKIAPLKDALPKLPQSGVLPAALLVGSSGSTLGFEGSCTEAKVGA